MPQVKASLRANYDRLVMLLALFCAVVGMTGPAAAQLGGPPHIAPRLEAETTAPAPGSEVMLAFFMTPEPNWHGYWENPGDAGQPMTLSWELPKGVSAGSIRYPVPGTFILGGLMNHVYGDPYALLVPLTIAPEIKPGTRLPVAVDAQWLACDDKVCVPEQARLAMELVAGDGAIPTESRARFDAWRAKLPRPLETAGREAVYMLSGKDMRIGVKLPAATPLDAPHMFLATDGAIAYAAPQRFYRSGDWLVMQTQPGSAAGTSVNDMDVLLKLAPDKGLRFIAVEGRPHELPMDGSAVSGGESRAFDLKLLLLALGGAILGGLILNIMPCVFPILSLKALAVSRAGGDERHVRREAWAYAAGVIAVCLALGAIILGLRAAGESVGWAFQLQNPVIVFLLMLLVAAIAANLAGWFELAGPSLALRPRHAEEDHSLTAAFATGALAAIVATPCTGPFMGAALGATLVLPGWAALAIFAGLGVGLALPFLLIAYSPALRARLPRPGPWMERFRKWMALPMALTALALLWLLGRMAGTTGLIAGVLGLVVIGTFALAYGRGQRQGKRMGALLLPLIIFTAFAGSMMLARHIPDADAKAELVGEPYSDARLAELRAAEQPVFVYFTADWCITCKANEAAAIDRTETAKAFKDGKVAVLVGDWTNGDPTITRALAAHGRNSVPLYLYYRPGQTEPEVLPQILTPAMLAALAK